MPLAVGVGTAAARNREPVPGAEPPAAGVGTLTLQAERGPGEADPTALRVGPEGIYPVPGAGAPVLAGYWRRVLGWVIDFLVVWVVGLLLTAPFRTVRFGRVHFHVADQSTGVTHYYTYSLLAVGLFLVLVVLYGAIFCGSRKGQTLGMMAAGVRVVDQHSGGPIGFWRALLRAVAECFLFLVFAVVWVVDVLFPTWDRRRQTLHDKAAGSVVIVAPTTVRDEGWPPPATPGDPPGQAR